jgi:hypothetical protein
MLESASPLSVVDWNKEREDPLRTHVIVFQFLAVLLYYIYTAVLHVGAQLLYIYCCTTCRRPAAIYILLYYM